MDDSVDRRFSELLALLDLEEIDTDVYRGRNESDRVQRLFGGQVAAQSLVAAGRTVERGQAHSLHGYFLRPGDPTHPVLYTVDRIRDGKSFTTGSSSRASAATPSSRCRRSSTSRSRATSTSSRCPRLPTPRPSRPGSSS